jgi:hypothetical protein
MRDPKPGPRPGPKNDRRTAVAYADHFARQAAKGQHLSPTEAFRYAYRTNLWGGSESPSGPGSSLDQTGQLQQTLPELFRRLGVRALLDLPCGDWRPLNFEQPPFGFPRPIEVLREGCTEQEGLFADKSLALWRVADLPRSGQVFMLCQ